MSEARIRRATLAILRLAQPRARWFLPGLAAGVASAVCAVALLATSAWLITRAAEQPPILYLSMAVVGVRAFALGRSAFRYLDRLTSHDAAFRQLSLLRVGVFSRIVPLAPAGLAEPAGASCSPDSCVTWMPCRTCRCGSSSRWRPPASSPS